MVNHTLKSVSFTPSNTSPSPFPPPPPTIWTGVAFHQASPDNLPVHIHTPGWRERGTMNIKCLEVSCLRTQHISPTWSQSQTFLPRVQHTDHCVFHILSNKTEQSHNFGLKPHFEYHWAQHLFLPCFLQILGSSCQVLSSDPGSLAQELCVS